ncbi:uncharacterized protein TNCV_4645301 [Trichonephila clavipes]|nr:uncharacterized protein TNCV_4645301 [Trichonephila clavipes]
MYPEILTLQTYYRVVILLGKCLSLGGAKGPLCGCEKALNIGLLEKLLAIQRKFVNNCTLLNGKCKDSELSQSEIENSEKKLIRLVQSYYLPDAKSSNYIETYIDDEGRDGKIRTVRLKLNTEKMLRPIQRIYPLEIRSNENLQRGMEESFPLYLKLCHPMRMKTRNSTINIVKPAYNYKPGDTVATQRTQFGTRLKLRPKYFGPYEVTKVNKHDRYEVQKIGQHEGSNVTQLQLIK